MDTALSSTISGTALAVCARCLAWLIYCTGWTTPAGATADTRAAILGRDLLLMTAVIASFASGVTATIGTVSRSVRLRLVASVAIAGTTAFDASAACPECLFRSSARTVVLSTNASIVTATRIQIVFLIITLISFQQSMRRLTTALPATPHRLIAVVMTSFSSDTSFSVTGLRSAPDLAAVTIVGEVYRGRLYPIAHATSSA